MQAQVTRHEPYNEKADVFSLGCLLYELFARELRSAALLSQHADAMATAARDYAHKVGCCHMADAVCVAYDEGAAAESCHGQDSGLSMQWGTALAHPCC